MVPALAIAKQNTEPMLRTTVTRELAATASVPKCPRITEYMEKATLHETSFPSAGSTFKRPQGFFAAKLIEDAGLKGVSVGGAMVSEKHSGFVVNTGNATAKDVCMLTDMVKDKVKQQSGVDLELEVIKLGDFS